MISPKRWTVQKGNLLAAWIREDPFITDRQIDPGESEFQLQYVIISLENLLQTRKSGCLRANSDLNVSSTVVLGLESALKRARDRISGGASVRLLRCIQTVMMAGRQEHIQEKLQKMVLVHNGACKDKGMLEFPPSIESPRTAIHVADRLKHSERMRDASTTAHYMHPLQFVPQDTYGSSPESPRPSSSRDMKGRVKQQDGLTRCMTPPFKKRSEAPAARRIAVSSAGPGTSTVAAMAGRAQTLMGHEMNVMKVETEIFEPPDDEDDIAMRKLFDKMQAARTSINASRSSLTRSRTSLTQSRTSITAAAPVSPNSGGRARSSGFAEFLDMTPPPKLSGATSGFHERNPKLPRRPATSPASLKSAAEIELPEDNYHEMIGSPSNYNRLIPQTPYQGRRNAVKGRKRLWRMPQRPASVGGGDSESKATTNSLSESREESKSTSGKSVARAGDGRSVVGGNFVLRRSSAAQNRERRGQSAASKASQQLYETHVDRLSEQFMQQHPSGFERKRPTSQSGMRHQQDKEYNAVLAALGSKIKQDDALPKTRSLPLTGRFCESGVTALHVVDRSSTHEAGYMRSCVHEGVNPRLVKFLAEPSSKLNLENYMLQDGDLQVLIDALQAPKLAARNLANQYGDSIQASRDISNRPAIMDVNLTANRGLSDDMLTYFFSVAIQGSRLTGGPCIGPVRALCLAGCTGLGKQTLEVLSALLHRGVELRQLEELDLSGVVIPPLQWPHLTESISLSRSLRILRLAQTECGKHSQSSCTHVAELIGNSQCRRLESIDISGNHFLHEGCMAVGHALRNAPDSMQELNLSFNAGFASDPDKNVDLAAAFHHIFNPIMHVLEVLGETTLTRASFASCQLSYEEDCILEDVVESSEITHLDVSDNPHGEQGLRCLVRLLVRGRDADSQLEYLALSTIRNQPLAPDTLKYDFVDPSATYRLVLKNPQHRSILRLLLKRSEENEGWACFKDEVLDGKRVEQGMQNLCWKRLDRGGDDWQVPEDGVLKFSFQMPPYYSPKDDISVVFSKFERRQKVKVSFSSFARLLRLYNSLPDERSRQMILLAMSRDLVLKLSQVRHFSLITKELVLFMIVTLLPTVEERASRRVLFDLVESCRGAGTAQMVKQVKDDCRSLLYFNALHPDGHYTLNLPNKVDRGTAQKCIVISNWVRTQSGFKQRLDLSEHGNHEVLRHTKLGSSKFVFDSTIWQLPDEGLLSFDIVLPRIPLDEKGALDILVVYELVHTLQESQCNYRDRLCALRLSAHLICLTPEGLRELIEAFPNCSEAQKVPHKFRPRAEAYVIFYNRTLYHARVVSPRLLYNKDVFRTEESKEIQERLGWIHTFDLVNCHSARSNLGPRHGPIDMFTHDGWLVLKVLITLSSTEFSPNFHECFWSERAGFLERGYVFLIPSSWTHDLPRLGEFTCTWFSRPEEVVYAKRRELAKEYLGWTFPPKPQVKQSVAHLTD